MKQAVELNYKEKDGIMYPDIQNSNSREADETPLGKYGQMALSYLKEYHPHRYTYLLMEGELLPTMHRVNEEAHNYLNTIMEQMLKNDPIPDLTGYITEGQVVLDRDLYQKGVYPPITILPSLSRLMKDGIGEGFTREDHAPCATQLFAAYARVQEVRALASVIGEDELGEVDRLYMEFGRAFEQEFVSQDRNEDRTIEYTLDLGWKLLGILPRDELDRVDEKILDKYLRKD